MGHLFQNNGAHVVRVSSRGDISLPAETYTSCRAWGAPDEEQDSPVFSGSSAGLFEGIFLEFCSGGVVMGVLMVLGPCWAQRCPRVATEGVAIVVATVECLAVERGRSSETGFGSFSSGPFSRDGCLPLALLSAPSLWSVKAPLYGTPPFPPSPSPLHSQPPS